MPSRRDPRRPVYPQSNVAGRRADDPFTSVLGCGARADRAHVTSRTRRWKSLRSASRGAAAHSAHRAPTGRSAAKVSAK